MRITIKPYLDTRRAVGDVPVSMMLSLTSHGKSALIPVGVKIAPSLWDKKAQSVKKCPRKAYFDKAISDRYYAVQEMISKLSEEDEELMRRLTITEIKNIILERLDGKERKDTGNGSFALGYKKFVETKQGRTRQIYETTWKRICEFTDKAERLNFEDITAKWLNEFNGYMAKRSPAQNARSIHLRDIRAVFNFAIDEEMTDLYPFRKFKIKSTPTMKRSLSADDIRMIATMPLLPWQEEYRDVFMLIFYLIGINIVDLFSLTHENVQNGRIVYTRRKTKRIYSIKIEPEAQEILERRKGTTHLIDVADRYKDHTNFTSRFNKALKTFGTWEVDEHHKQKVRYKPYWDFLSSYWARHSWATIAYNDCNIPVDVISQALGHSMGNRVTMVYINSDSKKVDEANRKVIEKVRG
jgi:site-specific recombinase XerD